MVFVFNIIFKTWQTQTRRVPRSGDTAGSDVGGKTTQASKRARRRHREHREEFSLLRKGPSLLNRLVRRYGKSMCRAPRFRRRPVRFWWPWKIRVRFSQTKTKIRVTRQFTVVEHIILSVRALIEPIVRCLK